MAPIGGNSHLSISVPGDPDALWTYTVKPTGRVYPIAPPVFQIDGERVTAAITPTSRDKRPLPHGVVEYRLGGPLRDVPHLWLDFVVRLAPDNHVARFAYALRGTGSSLTRVNGEDDLTYAQLPASGWRDITEVRLAEFFPMAHSYGPAERPVSTADLVHRRGIVGPLLAAHDQDHSLLIGYEHGSQAPDAFLRYELAPDRLALTAVKGNYLDHQTLPYNTVWFHFAALPGDRDALATEYRTFLLHYQTEQRETRRPYLFYNTWALQERAKWWHSRPYRDPIHEDRMLAEIDVAHRLGIEVFVIDTGWYVKTGDWEVDPERFTGALTAVKKKLDEYGMRLGLWFGPLEAAVSTQICREHPEYQISQHGVRHAPTPVWETEPSSRMCLVSPYGDYFAEQLIRLAYETGATYFKWDAVGQYGCDDSNHFHGDASHNAAERADNYAFQLPLRLTEIADRVCQAVPGAIVDFDVTEPHRAMGLAFLASGKYFLINNGPYYASYDVPDEPGRNPMVFFFPGQARARVCRAPLNYDRWMPSTLFLTHYLPDEPESSQLVNMASLILGQNGIWGDLTAISDAGITRIAEILARYKTVRDDMTAAYPIRAGEVGGSPEIHEKLSTDTGRGAIVAFSPTTGHHEYVTARCPAREIWHTGNVEVRFGPDGRAHIDFAFDEPGGSIVFFS